MPPQVALGLRVKELRTAAGITQEELAERCDLFRTYMSRIESGLANPTVTVVVRLAESLGVGIGELFISPNSATAARTRSSTRLSRGRVR